MTLKDKLDQTPQNVSKDLSNEDSTSIKDLSPTSQMISQNETESHINSDVSKDNIPVINVIPEVIPDDLYKTNINKLNFLQTQLENDNSINTNTECVFLDNNKVENSDPHIKSDSETKENLVNDSKSEETILTNSTVTNDSVTEQINKDERTIDVPPRLKKMKKKEIKKVEKPKEYPDHLNPFSDDDEEVVVQTLYMYIF